MSRMLVLAACLAALGCRRAAAPIPTGEGRLAGHAFAQAQGLFTRVFGKVVRVFEAQGGAVGLQQVKSADAGFYQAHGTLDDNVPPYSTLLVVDALIKANKDFDLLLLPNRRHGFGSEPYMVRRRWDYFVRNLLGAEPPAGYELRPATPAMGRPVR